tara:strand:+ start:952 stop:1140 length:189 start_codon:yes stop_codon:yes gene_type:complete
VGFIMGNMLVFSNLAFPKSNQEKEGDLLVGFKKVWRFLTIINISSNLYVFHRNVNAFSKAVL